MRLESWRKIEKFNTNHPEKMEDEVFFGNMTKEEFEENIWKTKRAGNVAYGDDGKQLNESPQKFPIFIKKTEYEEFKKRVLI